mgnify:CR=1 FL=1
MRVQIVHQVGIVNVQRKNVSVKLDLFIVLQEMIVLVQFVFFLFFYFSKSCKKKKKKGSTDVGTCYGPNTSFECNVCNCNSGYSLPSIGFFFKKFSLKVYL